MTITVTMGGSTTTATMRGNNDEDYSDDDDTKLHRIKVDFRNLFPSDVENETF